MPARIRVGEDESLHSALRRFRKAVDIAYRRQFYKTRVGCYEKPSDRKRRENRARKRRSRIYELFGYERNLTVYIRVRELFSRGEDPWRSVLRK